ncbi:hypothetical protein F4778DRAFT_727406 [Xylariomycetidae sp. FL2044]|nr:hypothetical protein F4778DRAFT_727406 [Xylariomycetidae sp. FL2044]
MRSPIPTLVVLLFLSALATATAAASPAPFAVESQTAGPLQRGTGGVLARFSDDHDMSARCAPAFSQSAPLRQHARRNGLPPS